MAGRFIKLYDKILTWEWYKNINVKVLFLHLLLKANYKDMSFEGHTITRGQLVTSLPSLSAELGMTIKQIRGSLDHLIATGEVTSSAYPRYRIITIVHYDDYQSDGRQDGSLRAGERAVKGQAKGSQRAGERAVSIDNIEQIEQIEESRNIEPLTRESAKRFTPPTREDILTFCQTENLTIDADRFLDYYQSNGWKVGRNPMKDWKATVRNWARKDSKPAASGGVRKVVAQDYEQRAYDEERTETPEEMLRRLQAEMEW